MVKHTVKHVVKHMVTHTVKHMVKHTIKHMVKHTEKHMVKHLHDQTPSSAAGSAGPPTNQALAQVSARRILLCDPADEMEQQSSQPQELQLQQALADRMLRAMQPAVKRATDVSRTARSQHSQTSTVAAMT
jgi:hypothetical protein